MKKLRPLKVVHRFPRGVKVVGIVLFKGALIIATDRAVYRMRTLRSKPQPVPIAPALT